MARIIPAQRTTLAKIDRNNSITLATSINMQYMYSIFLWNLETGTVHSDRGIDPTGESALAEYYFSVPPKVHDMDEPFNSTITMTQNAGRVVESYGSLMKTVTLSGTTGFRPHSAGAKFTRSERTGHDDIITLRNVFRCFSDILEKGHVEVIMVWRNIKDGDYWIVEPKNFKLQQASNSPLTYSYTIQLQTLAPFNPAAMHAPAFTAAQGSQVVGSTIPDPQAVLSSRSSFGQRFKHTTQMLFKEYMRYLGLIKKGADDYVTGPSKKVLGALTALNNETFGSVDYLNQAATDLLFASDAMYDGYKNLFDPDNPQSNIHHLLHSANQFRRIAESILADNGFKKEPTAASDQRTRICRAYDTPNLNTGVPSKPMTGGSSSFLGNNPPPSSTASYVVSSGDDIHHLARRLCGDAKRWQELVVLNDLKPPYIAIARRPGVLGPGDTLLYPAKVQSNVNGMIKNQDHPGQNYDNDNVTDSSGLLDQTYGRDIRLISVASDGDGMTDLTDISVNQRGDMSTIVGVPNVQQGIRIKFSTERGELRSHPSFGAKFPIGRKATIVSFNDFRVNILGTLMSDGRVDNVKDLELLAEGDLLYVSAKIQLVHASDYIPTEFTLTGI